MMDLNSDDIASRIAGGLESLGGPVTVAGSCRASTVDTPQSPDGQNLPSTLLNPLQHST